ncbi:MAG: hypothetical protein HUJ56_01425 [Erysipelotrichaceae bacterium]|nr:hypothetical protein [Erysipelotrichaceae bacterium]
MIASFEVKPNRRYLSLLFCWVLMILAFLLSFIPSTHELIGHIAYDGDWLCYRIIRAIGNMIYARIPLLPPLGILIGSSLWCLYTDYLNYPIQVIVTDECLTLKYKKYEKKMDYSHLLIKEHKNYIEIGNKKDWFLKQLVIDDQSAFLAFLKERGVSFEK